MNCVSNEHWFNIIAYGYCWHCSRVLSGEGEKERAEELLKVTNKDGK